MGSLELEVAAVDPDAPPPFRELPAAVVPELLRVGHDHSPAEGLGSEADTMIGHYFLFRFRLLSGNGER